MDIAYISAFAALTGSIVGGLMSGIATWLAQRSQVQAGYRAHQISLREDLFRDFVVAASKAYSQALMSDRPELQDLVGMYSLVNTMQVLCFPRTIACAEQVMNATVETYFQPNKTFDDIRAMIKTGSGINPLSEFAEAARDELRTLGSR